jgi:hypothetical protein
MKYFPFVLWVCALLHNIPLTPPQCTSMGTQETGDQCEISLSVDHLYPLCEELVMPVHWLSFNNELFQALGGDIKYHR